MAPEKIVYLTREGLNRVEGEYKKLKDLRKAKLGRETPSVLYSEELNTEFVSFKEELDYIDGRVEELEYILKHYQIIKAPAKFNRDRIGLGAHVIVEVSGNKDEFQIVGTVEANPSFGKISNESPAGKALLDRRVGDEVIISSPTKMVYKIKKISY